MMRRQFFIGLVFAITVISIFVIYTASNLSQGGGEIVMPLDDVYIHFQYARQLAHGQPYSYNASDPATSGATSFIYPYVLAIGYWLVFQGLNLGIWAMLIGCAALFASMWAIYRLCVAFDSPLWLSIVTPVFFALTGSVSWHAMSGMETLLIVCFTIWTLLAFIEKRLNLLVITAILLALTRPEGSMMAGIVVVIYGMRLFFDKSIQRDLRQILWLALPILAIFVQPTVNFVMTGSFSASGSQAKSLLGLIPQDWNIILSRIIENFFRVWLEFFTGYSPSQDLWYVPILTVPLGMVGMLLLVRQREHRLTVVLILLWVIGVSGAISTLDTAFWHFKRYQMPLLALFVPLSVIPLNTIVGVDLSFTPTRRVVSSVSRLFIYSYECAVMPIFVVMTFTAFMNVYQMNVNLVRAQPLAMARWLAENTPADSLIAVHDVGMMRYMGGRNTLDIVGLTTASAAKYWRNGVGAVAEFLLQHQPDYIASYGRGHGYGLYMLADTRLYADPLAEFPVALDYKTNVALAADTQAIYQPDWESLHTENIDGLLWDVNIANIDSEEQASYQWNNIAPVNGYATVVYDFDVLGCDISHSQPCKMIEGARQISGEEMFVITLENTDFPSDMILVSRVHPINPISLDIYSDDVLIDTQWIPENPGHWLDIQTRIPANLLHTGSIIRVVPQLNQGELYVPAYHTLILDSAEPSPPPETYLASYQDGHILLQSYELHQTDTGLDLTLNWYSDGQATGNYRFFAHLYTDINQPPLAQWDNYLGNTTLPVGNWLDGMRSDTISLNMESLSTGTYSLMIGFYDSITHDRLMPLGDNDKITVLDDGRLILQVVDIP